MYLFIFYIALYCAVQFAVPDPYMDEIFHIPQAQRYCQGNATYDPHITTGPLLYLPPLVTPFPCSTALLRATVLVCGLCSSLLIADIVSRVHPEMHQLRTLRVGLSPIHFFTHALYYTEPISTLFVLLMVWCQLRGYLKVAGLIGALSVTARQFNIIWVFCSAVYVLLTTQKSWFSLELVFSLSIHACAGIGFAIFVILNGSVALGHQEYHGGSLHGAMLVYCGVFMLAMSGQVRPRFSWKSMVLLPILSVMGSSIVVHPFLLADNRHIAFTLWRRVFQFDWVRRGAIPLLLTAFSPEMSIPTVLFLFCTALSVCLTPLFEPRYFLLPMLFAVLFTPMTTKRAEWIGLAQCLAVNAVVLALFFGRTFEDVEKWGPGVQRIVW